jgi:hypothetical protein
MPGPTHPAAETRSALASSIAYIGFNYANKMARNKSPVGTVQERFSGNWLIRAYLQDLVQTGLYGRTPGEAAERLVSQRIQRAIEQGIISRRPPLDQLEKERP